MRWKSERRSKKRNITAYGPGSGGHEQPPGAAAYGCWREGLENRLAWKRWFAPSEVRAKQKQRASRKQGNEEPRSWDKKRLNELGRERGKDEMRKKLITGKEPAQKSPRGTPSPRAASPCGTWAAAPSSLAAGDHHRPSLRSRRHHPHLHLE